MDANVIFRDIPTKVIEILIPMAFRYAPDIALAMCLQAFAGLRASEAMNVRQESSPYGPGLIITEVGGKVHGIKIDLRKELVLRSDGTEIGLIKKARMQDVYPPFVGTVALAKMIVLYAQPDFPLNIFAADYNVAHIAFFATFL